MKQILLATGNQGKQREILETLGEVPFEMVFLSDLGLYNDVEETGTTYEENAFLKAEYFAKTTGLPTVAEDSGIEIPALSGELGVKTRRWGAGESASDEEWLDFFLKRMESETNRTAVFHCVVAFVHGSVRQSFSGKIAGSLLNTPQCDIPKGIPLSALFVPEGHTLAFAEMTADQKKSISHRGQAFRQFREFLLEK